MLAVFVLNDLNSKVKKSQKYFKIENKREYKSISEKIKDSHTKIDFL